MQSFGRIREFTNEQDRAAGDLAGLLKKNDYATRESKREREVPVPRTAIGIIFLYAVSACNQRVNSGEIFTSEFVEPPPTFCSSIILASDRAASRL